MIEIVKAELHEDAHYTVVLRLTLIMLIVHGATFSFAVVPIKVVAAVMLAFPGLLTMRRLWWLLVAALAFGNGWRWYSIDNHKYLITYWTLACALSIGRADARSRRVAVREGDRITDFG